ncbi:MAG: LysM peptidoglycan-binding domain-containing protein [Nitrospiraceae bacterium]
MRNCHRRLFETSIEAIRACYPTVRVGVLCAVGFSSALFAGCGELEPMREPEVVDLELTTETLKASVRDAQRTVAELRTDLEARRRELAEAQVARAQLEGRVREAERRVIEARLVIDLQREELAAARTERQRVSRSNLQLQGHMKQLQKQLSKAGESGQKAMQIPTQRNQPSEFLETPQMMANPAALTQVPANRKPSSEVEQQRIPTKSVSVQAGDTLWRIAQTYRVNLEHLRTLNQLTDNRIVIGQALWLPVDRPMSGVGADKGASTP